MSETGEWRVVRRRGRVERPNQVSERKPVRQKYDPNLRNNPSLQNNPRITGSEAVKWKFDLQKRRLDPKKIKLWKINKEETLSFLFKNFPENSSLFTLLHHFQKVRDVYDIYCPGKRDKEGQLFGFVRFPKKYEEDELLEKLNKIWIGSFKLQVFVLRFRREEKAGIQKNHTVQNVRVGALVEENLSFAEAVNGTRRGKEQMKQDMGEIQFQSKAEDKVWLDGCYVMLAF